MNFCWVRSKEWKIFTSNFGDLVTVATVKLKYMRFEKIRSSYLAIFPRST